MQDDKSDLESVESDHSNFENSDAEASLNSETEKENNIRKKGRPRGSKNKGSLILLKNINIVIELLI